MKKIPIEGWCFILIIFGYALNETWPLADNGSGHTFLNGQYMNVDHKYLWKGFTDLLLQCCKAGAICLITMHRIQSVAKFFYILYWYTVLNLFLYWYNFCQWPYPFYLMWLCLCIAAWKLWPKRGKVVKM